MRSGLLGPAPCRTSISGQLQLWASKGGGVTTIDSKLCIKYWPRTHRWSGRVCTAHELPHCCFAWIGLRTDAPPSLHATATECLTDQKTGDQQQQHHCLCRGRSTTPHHKISRTSLGLACVLHNNNNTTSSSAGLLKQLPARCRPLHCDSSLLHSCPARRHNMFHMVRSQASCTSSCIVATTGMLW